VNETGTAASLERQCEEMAAILGVGGPVREEVLRAALADPTYAQHLLVCRGDDEFLGQLMANPPRAQEPADAGAIGTGALLRRAAESLARWAATGFSGVPQERYQARLESCAACPHLQAPPGRRAALYALAGAHAHDRSVCGRCGCGVAAKARRASDTCPEPHPERPGLNRWGDPIPATS